MPGTSLNALLSDLSHQKKPWEWVPSVRLTVVKKWRLTEAEEDAWHCTTSRWPSQPSSSSPSGPTHLFLILPTSPHAHSLPHMQWPIHTDTLTPTNKSSDKPALVMTLSCLKTSNNSLKKKCQLYSSKNKKVGKRSRGDRSEKARATFWSRCQTKEARKALRALCSCQNVQETPTKIERNGTGWIK